MEKVVLEVTTNEIEMNGFEHYWDNIRRIYNADEFEVHSIGAINSQEERTNEVIYIELKSKRLREEG